MSVANWLEVTGAVLLFAILVANTISRARSRPYSDDVRWLEIGDQRQRQAQAEADAGDRPVILHVNDWRGEEGAIMTWVAWPERYWDGHG
jgi:hypothetical protein